VVATFAGDLAINNHQVDALGFPFWVIICSRIPDRIGIEQNKVGPVTFANLAPVGQTESSGRQGSHSPDGFTQGQYVSVANVMAQYARESAEQPGVGLPVQIWDATNGIPNKEPMESPK